MAKQALFGFPQLEGQSADEVNGMKHLQATVMLSGKSVPYDVETALGMMCLRLTPCPGSPPSVPNPDVLSNGTYSRFPRPPSSFIRSVLQPLPDVTGRIPTTDALLPPPHNELMSTRLNAVIRIALLRVPIPTGFTTVEVCWDRQFDSFVFYDFGSIVIGLWWCLVFGCGG